MYTDINFLSYLAQFCLEREMFQTKIVEVIQTHTVSDTSANEVNSFRNHIR